MSYEVVAVLGRGGTALVELAVDEAGRRVATKRVAVTGSAAQIRVARERLRREAEVLRRLPHPGIVPILDVIDDGGEVVLVFPAMAESLEDRVARLGPLPPAEVSHIGRSLLAALATAHRAGVVHRDIKPANVLFDDAGRPALADFGVAFSREATLGLTANGAVVGTPLWMAPEQAASGGATPAGDVFSLAATLCFAATGCCPSDAGRRHRWSVPGGLPAGLRGPLERMLDPRPERRPSAAALLGGIDGTRVNPVTGAGRHPITLSVRRVIARATARLLGDAPERRRRRLATGAVVGTMVAAAAVVGLAISLNGGGSTGPATHAVGRGWDFVPGTVLTQGVAVRANVVPVSAVDSFTTHVHGDALHLCWGSLHVTLAAPAETAEEVTVWKGATKVGQAVSANGVPATATIAKPSCFGADSEDLQVTVRALAATGAAGSADFSLTRDGGW